MAGQGFMNAVAAATPVDHSVTIRGIRFTPGQFSDLETGPLNELTQLLTTGTGFDRMSHVMREVYYSLKTIFGEAIDQFWNPETSRLTLHTSEIMLLGNAAVGKLADDPHYRAGTAQAEAVGAKQEAGQAFAGAVAAKLGPNPAEVALQAEVKAQHQNRIDELNRELAALRAESGV